jgi:hypothetical protein
MSESLTDRARRMFWEIDTELSRKYGPLGEPVDKDARRHGIEIMIRKHLQEVAGERK